MLKVWLNSIKRHKFHQGGQKAISETGMGMNLKFSGNIDWEY